MPLKIETFSNTAGGNAVYKAITHPLAVEPARTLLARLRGQGRVALYDPQNLLVAFDTVFPLDGVEIAGVFVQNVAEAGRVFRGHIARPVTELDSDGVNLVLIATFDSGRTEDLLRDRLSVAAPMVSFDALRIPSGMLSDKARYLSNLNFATNFAFFRDSDGHHTRLVTANYWSAYGGSEVRLWFRLFGEDGLVLAHWSEAVADANAAIVVDSRDIRSRFGLPAFTGQLFIHVAGAAGHDVVKYALDTYGDSATTLSCTHDANSWPSDRYAGLPAPAGNEDVVLWVQNSHPVPIPAGDIGIGVMGGEIFVPLNEIVAPFATRAMSVRDHLPDVRWPQQLEIRAGKHFVRPRYEIVHQSGRRRIAHPNVERDDLDLDRRLPRMTALLGKGFILPAPVLPLQRYASTVLPTPMATCQQHLPVKLTVYDKDGNPCAGHRFGNLRRQDSVAAELDTVIGERRLPEGYGHMELTYDFEAGDEADGWLHAIFRYRDRANGHAAETSFGAHVFNTIVTYGNEPQSYKGPPPGLSTRLFLRLGAPPNDTLCHLIYPASLPWRDTSDTALILMSGGGSEITRRQVRIRCGGSLLWHANEMFTAAEREAAGPGAYAVIRDVTCRLFGYHGLTNGSAFSLDHMFGF